LVFALCYAGSQKYLSKRNILLLALPPILILFFLWTDPWFGIFLAGKRQSGDSLIYDGGIGFWFLVIYGYLLILISIIIILQALFRYHKKHRGQIYMILLGILFPLTTTILSFFDLSPTPNLDLTPIAFTSTALFFSIAIFRYNFLDLSPIAHDILFENLNDAVIVLDHKDRIVEANLRAQELSLKYGYNDLIGLSIKKFHEVFSKNEVFLSKIEEGTTEVSIFGPPSRFFEMVVTSLIKKADLQGGHLITFRDITIRKESGLKLRLANQQLKMQIEEIKALQIKLREKSVRDHLTGLYNRRYLHEVLRHLLPRAKRENTPISFVLIDLDHFKSVNDSYGHAIGDDILVSLSSLLMKNARDEDIVCRFGGEEFLILLPGALQEDTYQRVETWRESFEESFPIPANRMIKVTFSAGIATFPEDAKGMDQLFAIADRRLYLAKKAGKNRVCDKRSDIHKSKEK